MNETTQAECTPVRNLPGQSQIFQDFGAGKLGAWLPEDGPQQENPQRPQHWPELARLLAAQNPQSSATRSLTALEGGAGAVLTGQQVSLFGGPLYTPLKAATALARARAGTACGQPQVALFWLATEDHDFAEISQVVFPAGRELKTLAYASAPAAAVPVGGLVLDASITALVEQATKLLGSSEATEALQAAYRPGRTLAEAFGAFYAKIFAAQGLLTVDASSRDFHRLGAPVLRAGIERADEFHAALVERNEALVAAGYHAQVMVSPQSSLLFLLDERTGARLALKRLPPSATEPQGLWQTAAPEGAQSYSTGDLLGILDAAPERLSPSALLRPVFQDFLFGTTTQVGGPAEIAYLAQSTPLFERILGRQTPPRARFSATLVEPRIAELLRRHELALEQIFAAENAEALALKLAERALPVETREKLAAAANAFDSELEALVGWMQTQDKGLGQSAETAAGKMRYQMHRLRTLAANHQLQRETTLKRQADSIWNALYPGGALQERVLGAAYFFARYGLELAERLTALAVENRSHHAAIWL